jgi:hypothetical protein
VSSRHAVALSEEASVKNRAERWKAQDDNEMMAVYIAIAVVSGCFFNGLKEFGLEAMFAERGAETLLCAGVAVLIVICLRLGRYGEFLRAHFIESSTQSPDKEQEL